MRNRVIAGLAALMCFAAFPSSAQVGPNETSIGGCKTCITGEDILGNQGHGYGESCSIIMQNCVDCHYLGECMSSEGPTCPEQHCRQDVAYLERILDRAIAADNTEIILATARQRPGTVAISHAGYLLILDCNGAVASAHRLQSSLLSELQAGVRT